MRQWCNTIYYVARVFMDDKIHCKVFSICRNSALHLKRSKNNSLRLKSGLYLSSKLSEFIKKLHRTFGDDTTKMSPQLIKNTILSILLFLSEFFSFQCKNVVSSFEFRQESKKTKQFKANKYPQTFNEKKQTFHVINLCQ